MERFDPPLQMRSLSRAWLSNLAHITQGAMESGSLMLSAGKGWVEEGSSECHSRVETEQGPLLAPGDDSMPDTNGRAPSVLSRQGDGCPTQTGMWSAGAKVGSGERMYWEGLLVPQ